MLISSETVLELLTKHNVTIRGALHIGAHECEERSFYNTYLKLSDEDVLWIDGNPVKVEEMKRKGIHHIYHGVLNDKDGEVVFNITDNSQASSILELNHENGYYNDIHIVNKITVPSYTLSTFVAMHSIDIKNLNFWNLDIQGSELNVLKGSPELLQHCDVIYTEVNSDHVYKNCGLVTDIDDFLQSYGFARVHTTWTSVKWGDAIYIKNAI
jgi:FkbM family methyltransferase